ncbi:MAG: DUF481 domain-containing protein [Rubrivivax sp.]|nr:DUF481 domain-containing protein [Rubrivivax sp.]
MHTPGSFARWLLILLATIAVTRPALAREKRDIVILKNGDRITCEIKSLARGMLTVSTDSMGTVEIKWQDVERITSKYLFTVQDTEGNIYTGSLLAADEGRRVNVEGTRAASRLDHLAIVQIQELGGSRWRRFSGSASLGTSFTKASDRKQLDFSGDVMYRAEKYSGQLKYSTTFGTSRGETDADRKLLTLAGTRQLSRKWLAYSQMSFEHNLELQLDRRYSFLGGPGYRIAQSNRSLVTAIGAAAFTRESYFGEGDLKNAEGFFGIDAQFFKLYSPKFDIVSQVFFLPNFTTRDRRRFEVNTTFRIEILRDFFVNLTFYDSYDSKPPSEDAVKNDYGFTTGLSWSFRR